MPNDIGGITDREFKRIRIRTALRIHRDLQNQGYSYTQILGIYSNLIGLVGRDLKKGVKKYIIERK